MMAIARLAMTGILSAGNRIDHHSRCTVALARDRMRSSNQSSCSDSVLLVCLLFDAMTDAFRECFADSRPVLGRDRKDGAPQPSGYFCGRACSLGAAAGVVKVMASARKATPLRSP